MVVVVVVRVVRSAKSGSLAGTTSAHSSRHLLISLSSKCSAFDDEPCEAMKRYQTRWDCSRVLRHEPQ